MLLGHLFAQDGWQVEYHGIKRGLQDLGRDLVCSKGGEVKIDYRPVHNYTMSKDIDYIEPKTRVY